MRSIEILSDVNQLAAQWREQATGSSSNLLSRLNRNNANNSSSAEIVLKKSRELFLLEEKELGFEYGEHVLAICVPFYNEDAYDMHRTLTSLHTAILELQCKFGHKKKESDRVADVVIFLIGDGYAKCSESMRAYLSKVFNVADQDDIEPDRKSVAKVIAPGNGSSFSEFHSTFKLRLLMKAENAGKHNSQEWFLKMAAPALQCKYIFMTDCGTFFQKDCLMFLLRHLLKNPDDCVGATGHQRVMRWGDQNLDFSWHGALFTFAQGFDYEASQSMFSVPFAAIGSLPVIPGPCGMYNLHLLQESGAIDAYFEALHNANAPDLITGNLNLAEDRILCFEAVKRSGWRHKTHIDPRAVFFFEAETDAERFLQQRRRWHNGTVAGYVRSWKILASELFSCCSSNKKNSTWFGRLGPDVADPLAPAVADVENQQADEGSAESHGLISRFGSSFRMVSSFILVTLQLLMHFFMSLSIGIFAIAFHFALNQLFPNSDNLYTQALLALYLFLNFVFVYLHHRRSLVRLHKPVFYVLLCMNVIVSVVICGGYASFVYTKLIPTINDPGLLYTSNYLIRFLPFFWFIMTLVLALLHGFRSFGLWIMYLVPYVLLLPTMVSTVPLYAECRMWELSWGNRPTDPSSKVRRALTSISAEGSVSELAKQYLEQGQSHFDGGEYESALNTLESAKRILHAEDSAKLISQQLQKRKWFGRTAASDQGKTNLKSVDEFQKYVRYSKELQDQCTILVFVSVLLNALLALVMVELQGYQETMILYFTGLIFFPVVIFQTIAIIYWICFIIFRRRMGLYPCWQGFKRCCLPSYRHRYQAVR